MATTKRIYAADLFCGAGGSSTGLGRAAERLGRRVELTAVNHWDRAIETHSANHPKAAHFCQSLADLDPRKAIPGGKLDLLVASPECTHHSIARGGKPVNDQSRSTAYCVHRWCAALDVRRVLIENVPEFTTWGPLGTNGKPLKGGKGKLFEAYLQTFRAMGYRVEWRVLNAANFGAHTSRRRLFIQCAKGKLPIRWPDPTHQPDPQPGLFETLPRWKPARDVIDWSLRGTSIFGRARPLSENTLKRIEAGLRKFGGANAEPFLILLRGTDPGQLRGSAKSLDSPVPPVTCSGAHLGLVEPFLMSFNGAPDEDRRRHDLARPLPTQHCSNRFGLVQPFIVGRGHPHANGSYVYDANNPLPTVTSCEEHGIVEPFVVSAGGPEVDARSVSRPLNTVLTRDHMALVEPFILPPEGIHRGNLPRSLDDPMQTVTAGRGAGHVVEPFTVPYYANGAADSLDDPLRTVTTRDRFGLCEPTQHGLRYDILFRMIQPDESKCAMGFGRDYKITGNKTEQMRQIGNAVEVNQADALCAAMMEAA